jgi:CYTH domain-containing protein
MHQTPKYAQPEIERRWLVVAALLPDLSLVPRRDIEDRYVHGGRLRLRTIHTPGETAIFKLGKKYPRRALEPENVVSVYLSTEEHALLAQLPSSVARKSRYAVGGGSLDVYHYPSDLPAIFEVEFPSKEAALQFVPPPFVAEEVTFNASYTGFALAQRAP